MKTLVAAAVAGSLILPSTALAHNHHRHRRHHRHSLGAEMIFGHHYRRAWRAGGPMLFAAEDENVCSDQNRAPLDFLASEHAKIMRVVVLWQEDLTRPLACIKQAYASGYKVYMSMQFNGSLDPADAAQSFLQRVSVFLPYLWAIGVGNEQEGNNPVTEAPYDYRFVWNIVEPVLAREAPNVLRVFGETTPWGYGWLRMAVQTGGKPPAGAAALAVHCYMSDTGGLQDVPDEARWAASVHLPLWCSEMSPDTSWTSEWITPHPLSVYDSVLSRVISESPDLKMVSYYNWPEMYPGVPAEPPSSGRPLTTS